MQRPCAKNHIVRHHQGTYKPAAVCGEGRSFQSQMARKDEHIVKHPVDDGRDDVGVHGKAWRAVETDDKKPQGFNHQQQAGGQKPQVVLACGGIKAAFHPQQVQHSAGEKVAHSTNDNGDEYACAEGLGDVDACRLVVAFGEVDGCHHADTHSHHHSQPVDKHHNRGNEIDGRQSVAADAVSDKNAVGKQECHVEKHAQQGGEEDAGKQTPNACLAEINVVSVVVHGGVLSGVQLLAMRKRQGADYCRLPVSLLRETGVSERVCVESGLEILP